LNNRAHDVLEIQLGMFVVILMSRSFMARTRDQSVLETLEEEDFFMSSGMVLAMYALAQYSRLYCFRMTMRHHITTPLSYTSRLAPRPDPSVSTQLSASD
jgi:hypothetical protein